MYSNTIFKLDLIIIIIRKYCEKYLENGKNIDIKKSKTIKFVLEQINDIKKTKDFKVLKSIFTIEKKYKIKDIKDWLSILCVNKPQLFSKHFKLDLEIDLTKGYRTYVNLLSKLGVNKTKCDLKTSTKKISTKKTSILFNLLFYNIIDGDGKIPVKTYTLTREKELYNKLYPLIKHLSKHDPHTKTTTLKKLDRHIRGAGPKRKFSADDINEQELQKLAPICRLLKVRRDQSLGKDYFKNVAIRPGKPILFAKIKGKQKVIFGLPGNPMSSAACFRFFVYPYIENILGLDKEKPIPTEL